MTPPTNLAAELIASLNVFWLSWLSATLSWSVYDPAFAQLNEALNQNELNLAKVW